MSHIVVAGDPEEALEARCASPTTFNPVVGLVDSIDEVGLGSLRLLPDFGAEELRANPTSIASWIQNIIDAQRKRLDKSIQESLIMCQSLDTKAETKTKYANVFAVLNVKVPVQWPPCFSAAPLSQYFVRTFEAG